jgi:superfamily I DNA and/or RNA helicase
LFEAYEKYQQNFKFALESARQCVKDDANILLTTFGSIHKVFDFLKEKNEISSKFTFIIDEASTVEAWKVLYLEKYVNDLNGHLKQLILIGDTKQLSVFFPNGTNDEKESILDILDSRQTHHLTSTYRCPQKIVDLMNKNFYKKNPLNVVGHSRTIENAIAWIHSEGVNDIEFDYHEIEMIRKTIIKFTCVENSILILSPYKKQVELLQSMILTYGIQNTHVLTIDKSQGNEADIVILSLVKSNPTSFLTKRRSNVMISRTRDKLIVFGNRNNALTSSNAVLRSLAKNSGFKNL